MRQDYSDEGRRRDPAGRASRRYFVAELAPAGWQPNVDVYQTDEAIVAIVEIAGIRAEEVDISIDGRILRLTGSRAPHFLPGSRQFYQLEIPQGAFERTVRLPAAVDGEQAQATYREGFLEVVLPLSRPFRPTISPATRGKENSRQ
jgi:HSP20 family protein